MEATVTQKFTGKVVSVGVNTLVAEVVTYKTHPKYLKKYRSSKRYHVHTDSNTQKIGDVIDFIGCRPISRTKKFKVVE